MVGSGQNIQRPEVENRNNAFDPRSGKFIQAGPPKFKRFFVINQIDGNYLLCMDEHSLVVVVALPFSLQESTVYGDGKTYTWGEIVTTVDSAGKELSWQQQRTVTDKASVSSTELSSPPYVLGEPLIAMHFINDKDPSVKWIDSNASGRSWSSDKNHLAAFQFFGLGQTGTFKKGGWVKDGDGLFVLQDDMPTPFVDSDFVWAVTCGGSVCSAEITGTEEYLVPASDAAADGSQLFEAMTLDNIRAGILDETLSEFKYSNVWKPNLGGTSEEHFMESVPYDTLFTTLGFLLDVELNTSPAIDSALLFDTADDKWKDVAPIILTPVGGIPAGADGIDGLGQDGTDGTDGVAGTNGIDGTSGTDGTDGTDGVVGDAGTAGDTIETVDGYWLSLGDNLYSWVPAQMRVTSGATGVVGDWVNLGGATAARNSVEMGDNGAAGGAIQLVNDLDAPDFGKIYGTDLNTGEKGWHYVETPTHQSLTSTLKSTGPYAGQDAINLVGDEDSPDIGKVYGVDSAGDKGWIAGLPTGTDKSTMFYDATAWVQNLIMQWWKAADATYLKFDFSAVATRAGNATMPGIVMFHPGDNTYPCGMFCNVEDSTNGRFDLGWGGAGGGNFELYANSHGARAGQFRAIIGPSGYYEFKKYVGGTTWKTIAGISNEGRLICGYNDTGFPGSGDETGTQVAPEHPLNVFDEEVSSALVAYIDKDGTFYGELMPATNEATDVETIGGTGEGSTDAAEGTTFVGDNENSTEVNICSRVAFGDTGDETLYGYSRTMKFDRHGRLYSISGETKYTIDVPEEET